MERQGGRADPRPVRLRRGSGGPRAACTRRRTGEGRRPRSGCPDHDRREHETACGCRGVHRCVSSLRRCRRAAGHRVARPVRSTGKCGKRIRRVVARLAPRGGRAARCGRPCSLPADAAHRGRHRLGDLVSGRSSVVGGADRGRIRRDGRQTGREPHPCRRQADRSWCEGSRSRVPADGLRSQLPR